MKCEQDCVNHRFCWFGKSTVRRIVAEYFSKSMHIKVDDLQEMMVKGIEPPGEEITQEAYRQFQWARNTVIYMAQLYASQGVVIVIDNFCSPPNFAEQYAEPFKTPLVHRVLLFPKGPTLIERMKKRAGPWDPILVDAVPMVYSYLEPMPKDGWIVLDSGDWTIEQTVQQVLSKISSVS